MGGTRTNAPGRRRGWVSGTTRRYHSPRGTATESWDSIPDPSDGAADQRKTERFLPKQNVRDQNPGCRPACYRVLPEPQRSRSGELLHTRVCSNSDSKGG